MMWKKVVALLYVGTLATVGHGMEVVCSIDCGDVNQDCVCNELDFGTILGSIGVAPSENDEACLDSYTADDYNDVNDALLWDAASGSENFCGWKLWDPSILSGTYGGSGATYTGSGGPGYGSSFLIAGKMNVSGLFSSTDKLYVFNNQGSYDSSPFSPISTRPNGRITCGYDGNVYQVNTDIGVVRLNDGAAVVTKGGVSFTPDPRYNGSAVVYIGMKSTGSDNNKEYAGRPILDVAVDAEGYIYIVPVLVVPNSTPANAYLAAAKLQPLPGQTPCYSVVKVYDDGVIDNDHDPTRIGLKEIEVDAQGNVYIISAYHTNSSNYLWAYPPSGSPVKVALDTLSGVTGGIPDPTALCASRNSNVIYLSSGYRSPTSTSTSIYALSTENLALTLSRTVPINGMGHATGITENPATGVVWVTGFTMSNIPDFFNPSAAPFYHPYLAQVPATGSDPVTASQVTSTDLGLPISITWMPANQTSSTPANEHTLWRTQRNTFRLYFDGDITAPASGNVTIQEMQDNGQFGSDVSSSFSFTVENDGSDHPRILRIRETTQTFTDHRWYAVRNTGAWKGVAKFEVQYQIQWGDVNDDGQVATDDWNLTSAAIITWSSPDSERRDINGDGKIMANDCSYIYGNKPSSPTPKPSGH